MRHLPFHALFIIYYRLVAIDVSFAILTSMLVAVTVVPTAAVTSLLSAAD